MVRSPALFLALGPLLGCAKGAQDPPAPATPPFALVQLHSELDACFREPAPELRSACRDAVRDGWSDPRHELEQFLDANRAAIALLTERTGGSADLAAHAFPGGGFEPRLDEATRYAELLVLAGRERERSRPDEALGLYLTALRFAHRHIAEKDAPLTATIVGWNMQDIALDAIRDLVHRSRTTAGAWREAIRELGSLRSTWRALAAAHASDRAHTRKLLERSLAEETKREFLARYEIVDAEYAQVFADAWRAGRPEQFREAISELAPSPQDGITTVEPSSDELELDQTVRTLIYLAYSELYTVLELDLVRKLDVDMLRIAIAVKLYRDDHGARLPDSLEELVPGYLESIPEDLFAPRQPLRLAREGAHWWIYSVGPDRIDQGGRSAYDRLDPEAGGDLLSVAEHPRE